MKPPDLEQQTADTLRAEDWGEVDRLSAQLDEADDWEHTRRAATISLLPAALWYAAQGLQVFPLRPGMKIPHAGSHGCKDATGDPDRIRAWWRRDPDANIGLATGHLVDVIDIDGYTGAVSWARTMYDDTDTYDGPPILGTVSTPRAGGRHLYVAADPGKGNRAGLLPGVDHRGLGGYVVSPPSRTEVGVYRWVRPLEVKL